MKKLLSIMVLVLLSAALLSACSSSNNGVFGGGGGGGNNVISAKGGEGAVGGGGYGGAFMIDVYDATNVKITGSGSVDASIDTSTFDELISSSSRDFGAVLLDVTSSMTISSYPTGTVGLTDGLFYMHDNSSALWKYDAGVEVQVTGIHVHPGVTLTLGLNANNGGDSVSATCPLGCNSGFDTAYIAINNDIWNQGTIKTLDLVTGKDDVLSSGTNTADGSVLDMGSLELDTNGIWLNDGTILTRGSGTTDTMGGFGGNLFLGSNKVVVNRGTVDVSGGKGTYGGYAGDANLGAWYGVLNTGPVSALGGKGDTLVGGYGGYVGLGTLGYLAPVYNSATLDASGGNGATGGGPAGGCGLYSSDQWRSAGGDIVNTGSLVANGGDALTSGSGGYSGWDGGHQLIAYGANIRNTGAIEAKGGKGADSYGGGGGSLDVVVGMAYDYQSQPVAAGNVQFSGNIIADAGSGENGGSAAGAAWNSDVPPSFSGWSGGIRFTQDNYFNYSNGSYLETIPLSGSIELIGYSKVDLKGGKGETYGQLAGAARLFWEASSFDSGGNVVSAPGSFYNDVAFDMTGGEGVTGSGGTGGTFFAEINSSWYEYDYNNWKPGTKGALGVDQGGIENHGNITTRGGKGKTSGGNSGSFGDYATEDNYSIFMYASGSIINTGNLDASGGAASDKALGEGGGGNPAAIYAVGDIANSGSILTSGGYGAISGGGSGWSDLYSIGGLLVNSASITANGGNADASLAGSTGGYASDIYLWAMNNVTGTKNTGALQAKGGTGETPGGDGTRYIDNVPQP